MKPLSLGFLVLAVVCEVTAMSVLKMTEGFTRLIPTIVVMAGYVSAFYLLSLVLRDVPVGVTYAIWSGAGIVLVTLVAYILYHQALDFAAITGISLILAGVLIISLLSQSVA